MALVIALTVLAFLGGVGLSWWQARRRFRRELADRLAHEVEREMARRVVEQMTRRSSSNLPKP